MGGTRFVVGALQQILLKRFHTARVALLEPDAAADGAGGGGSGPPPTADGSAAAATSAPTTAEGLRGAVAGPGPPVGQLGAFEELAAGRLPPRWRWLPDAKFAIFTATNLPRLDMNFHLAPMATPDSGDAGRRPARPAPYALRWAPQGPASPPPR
jgi:hypothetical protein